MALPSSGPISMSMIAAEFGGSPPHSLSEYYGAAAGVPASGTIKFSDFYGKSAGSHYSIVVGSHSVPGIVLQYGYATGSTSMGSISPNASYKGATILWIAVASTSGSYFLQIGISGNRPQNFFSKVNVQGIGELLSANANLQYEPSQNTTSWTWLLGGWGTWNNVGATRTVSFFD